MRKLFIIFSLFQITISQAQNPLAIPTALTDTAFNLNIKNGTVQFYTGINTKTYGINGAILAPTLIVNKWDWVTMNVTNNLTGTGNSTTIHWHGLHVPAMDDGGPHQVINQGTTWSPHFQILNSAGTFWYHPHGDNKTDLHVSKGIAGMIIIRDSTETALTLPRTYGVDDIPIVVQTKAFDVLTQIAIATEMDTAILVNGTMHPYLDAPAQVVRLRLLNGSSGRTFNFGFTGNKSFKMIASDGGLLDSAITLTRIVLSPGERAEILLDLQGMNGQNISLNSFSSEMPNGIYGAKTVTGMMGGKIPDYDLNPLNGADFEILKINIVAQNATPITTIPSKLANNIPWKNYSYTRDILLQPDTMMSKQGQVEGPFNINGTHFDINTINATTYLNTIEKWKIVNRTGIAHPFHIHDVEFYILNINGGTVPKEQQGKKDVVLVKPGEYIEFITKFEDFADNNVPYMYHCHVLHHEDDGMMGSFRVIDTTTTAISNIYYNNDFKIYPNPTSNIFSIQFGNEIQNAQIKILNVLGETVLSQSISNSNNVILDASSYSNGIYFIQIKTNNQIFTHKIIKQ